MENKRNKAVLMFGILVTVVGLLLNVKVLMSVPFMSVTYFIINVVPGLVIIMLWWYKPTIRLGLVNVITVALSLAILFTMNLSIGSVRAATNSIIDSGYYEDVLKVMGYPDTKLVAHFPKRIPDDATEVRFYYLPKFLQGAMYLQLRYKSSTSDLVSLIKRYKPLALLIQNGCNDTFDELNNGKDIALTRFRNEKNTGFGALPEDFQVLVLGTSPNVSKFSNHGYSYGIAINKMKNEVIYWVENW